MSANPEPNIPLLRKCVEWAEAEAEKPLEDRQWEQGFYRLTPEMAKENVGVFSCGCNECRIQSTVRSCGTAYCIAGYAVEVSGLNWSDKPTEETLSDGRHAEEAASDLLGLTPTQAGDLFAGGNTIKDVRRIAEEIAGERL